MTQREILIVKLIHLPQNNKQINQINAQIAAPAEIKQRLVLLTLYASEEN